MRSLVERAQATGVYGLLRTIEAVGIVMAVVLFAFDWADRAQDRDARTASLIATNLQLINGARGARGNMGQIYALEMLHRLSRDGSFSLVGLNLSDLDLSDVDLDGADLSYASLRATNLTQAKLRNAHLNSNLNGANFHFADLTGAQVVDAALDGAVFFNTVATGADFTNTTLSLRQVRGLCYSEAEGKPPRLWQVKSKERDEANGGVTIRRVDLEEIQVRPCNTAE